MYLENGLTEKQERFCNEYLVDYNATQAATRSGYSANTAYSIAHELLSKPEIRQRIDELQDNIFANLSEKLIIEQIWRVYKTAIEDKKLSDALKAQELLGKYKAMFVDKQITQTETFEDHVLRLESQQKDSIKTVDVPLDAPPEAVPVEKLDTHTGGVGER